jgi:hypothetical protein
VEHAPVVRIAVTATDDVVLTTSGAGNGYDIGTVLETDITGAGLLGPVALAEQPTASARRGMPRIARKMQECHEAVDRRIPISPSAQ